MTTPDGPVVGEPAAAASPGGPRLRRARLGQGPRAARRRAPASPGPPPAGVGTQPGQCLNERAQTGAIAESRRSPRRRRAPPTGPSSPAPPRCTAPAGVLTPARPRAASKNEAKAAAATVLLGAGLAPPNVPSRPFPRPPRDQARSPRGHLRPAPAGGLPVDFTRANEFWLSAADGSDLPGPLAECDLPLLAALPVLAAWLDFLVSGTIAAATSLDPSALAWASAAKAALEAVAARRVYPALDADGRDCWRLAPIRRSRSPMPSPGSSTRSADALLRPPGRGWCSATCLTRAPPRLDRRRAEWADRAAERGRGTQSRACWSVRSARLSDGTARAPVHAVLRARDPSPGSLSGRRPGWATPEQRLLRRACRDWPPLERVRRDGALSGAEAAAAPGPGGNGSPRSASRPNGRPTWSSPAARRRRTGGLAWTRSSVPTPGRGHSHRLTSRT